MGRVRKNGIEEVIRIPLKKPGFEYVDESGKVHVKPSDLKPSNGESK